MLAEMTGIPVVTTLMARGAFPDCHPQHLGMPGMHGTVAAVGGAAAQRPDHQPRRALRRPGHRQPRLVRPARQGDPRRHRPRRDRQEPPRRRADRRRRREVIADLVVALQAEQRRRAHQATTRPGWSSSPGVKTQYPLGYDKPADGSLAPQYVHRAARRDRRPGGDLRRRRRPAPDVGHALRRLREPAAPGSTPAASAPWASRCRPRWAPRSAARTPPCGRSTATAASR